MTMMLMPGTLLSEVDLPPFGNKHPRVPHHRIRSLFTLGSMELKRHRLLPLCLLLTFLHHDDLRLVLPSLRCADNDDLLDAHLLHRLEILLALDSTFARVEIGGSENLAGAVEGEAAVDEGTHFIVEGLAVVNVQSTGSVTVFVESDDQSEGIVLHEARGTTRAVAAWDDVATLHKKRNLFERSWYSVVPSAAVSGEVKVVVVGLVVREVDRDTISTFLCDWLGEKTSGTNVELVVDFETTLVGRVDPEVGSDDRRTSCVSFMESSVPGRQKLVTKTKGLSDDLRVRRASNVWLAATSVDMSVATEERVVDTSLVPASQEFFAWVTEETSNIRTTEGEARDTLV